MDIDHSTGNRFLAELERRGIVSHYREYPEGTRTAQDAAVAIGCDVSQIVKSLIFRGKRTGVGYLVLTSGSRRVDEKRLSENVGEEVGKADANFVREQTSYAIGGVPPFGYPALIRTIIDPSLLSFAEIWGAAGTPHTVFSLTPELLLRESKGETLDVFVQTP